MADFDMRSTLASAERSIDAFRRMASDVEALPRGVLPSEAFFVCAAVGDHQPPQVLESGRALGQSTQLLSRWFASSRMVSVDAHRDHPDAAAALKRLEGQCNLACLFGDGRRVLPAIVLPGDIAVIDGPKEIRAIRLALSLLNRGAAAAFVHDCRIGTAARRFLQRHVPWAYYSDHRDYVRHYCHLDRGIVDEDRLSLWSDPDGAPRESYGGTFACIPARPGFPGRRDFARLRLARIYFRMRRKFQRQG